MKNKLPLSTKNLTIEIDDATYKTLESIAKKRYEEPMEELAADLLEWATTGLAATILKQWMEESNEDDND